MLLLPSCVLAMVLLLAGPVASQPERVQPAASGGGEYAPPADQLTETERTRIEQMIAGNVTRLAAEGRLPAARGAVALGWPLTTRDGFSDPGYHGVTNYVDHQSAYPNQVLDFACGRRTYDSSSGYNHKGTDYYLWPFAWNKMAAGDVRVVAAAAGVIVGRHEGNPDQSCSFNSNSWNAVYVRHADGSVAWYGHLKRGSVTPKGVGAPVAAGEYLGLVGSSGNSTGPHLHFELYSGGQLIDPYAGGCYAPPGGSWWAQQREYYDSAINKLTTGPAAVAWSTCPSPDTPNEATQFQPGNRIYFTTYYRDQLAGQSSLYRIYAPNGTIYAQWTHSSSQPHYALSYWWWAFDFGPSAMNGTWRFSVEYNGRTYTHSFVVGQPSTATPTVTATPTATATLRPTATATPTATPTVTPSVTPAVFDPAWYVFVPAMAK